VNVDDVDDVDDNVDDVDDNVDNVDNVDDTISILNEYSIPNFEIDLTRIIIILITDNKYATNSSLFHP